MTSCAALSPDMCVFVFQNTYIYTYICICICLGKIKVISFTKLKIHSSVFCMTISSTPNTTRVDSPECWRWLWHASFCIQTLPSSVLVFLGSVCLFVLGELGCVVFPSFLEISSLFFFKLPVYFWRCSLPIKQVNWFFYSVISSPTSSLTDGFFSSLPPHASTFLSRVQFHQV